MEVAAWFASAHLSMYNMGRVSVEALNAKKCVSDVHTWHPLVFLTILRNTFASFDQQQGIQHPVPPQRYRTESPAAFPGGSQTHRCFRLSGRVTQTTGREDGLDWRLNRGELSPSSSSSSSSSLMSGDLIPLGVFFGGETCTLSRSSLTLSEEAVPESGLVVFR